LLKINRMNKKVAAVVSVLIILAFIGYMIYDSVRSKVSDTASTTVNYTIYPDGNWKISDKRKGAEGGLKAVTVSPAGNIYLGGDSFVLCYNKDFKLIWNIKTPAPVTALSFLNDSLYACLLYTSPSPRDRQKPRMPSSA